MFFAAKRPPPVTLSLALFLSTLNHIYFISIYEYINIELRILNNLKVY
jgi:hypothetical protein